MIEIRRLELGILWVLFLPVIFVLAIVLAFVAAVYEYVVVFKSVVGMMPGFSFKQQ